MQVSSLVQSVIQIWSPAAVGWGFEMAGGRGKKKRNSKDSTGSNGKKKSTGRKKGGRGGGAGSSGKSVKVQGDIFSEGAMENAYLLCHNVQVRTRIFGFER